MNMKQMKMFSDALLEIKKLRLEIENVKDRLHKIETKPKPGPKPKRARNDIQN